jgi:hypothetical protein
MKKGFGRPQREFNKDSNMSPDLYLEFMNSLDSITKLTSTNMANYYTPDEEIKRLTYKIQNDPLRIPVFYSERHVEFR